ncbi:zinc finger CCCH domain-containing protein 18 isoform X2 [Anoplophora glabripennis]|uniref:zinc finger CCCH domain-containing protein 18 isoform X2 n=1 Tax=Anoplophora glabripennis TaxID=217634 RepID=UPI0008741405|nr:zinc finger CCCH domain-containing protein 18 isoform X2 [Anoplophora glabripennis]
MDSEDSRDASSGNESDDKEQHSPASTRSRSRESNARSNRSQSRSSSPPSRHQSASPQSRPISPDSAPQSPQNDISSRKSSDAHSAASGSSSSDDEGSHSRSRPYTPKSLESVSYQKGDHKSGTPSPGSPASEHRSSRSGSPTQNEAPPMAPRSPSHNSSRSSSPGSPARAATKTPVSDNENASVKSASSHSSKKSRSSRVSDRSSSSQGSRRSRGKSNDGNSSDSSESSVDSSSRRNKNISKNADTQPEEISDGDMESDNEKVEDVPKESSVSRPEINISHEDLSDVSDLEDCIGDNSDDDRQDRKDEEGVQENSNNHLNEKSKSVSPEPKKVVEKNNRTEEGEEQLDFEAEDGECGEIEPSRDEPDAEKPANVEEGARADEKKEDRELEEGEVTDEDDARPEETEPRPVCRFFSRGQCTWGASCRFLHPGVTDKGNYTMFELIRPVVPGEFGRDERLYGKTEPPLVESAWERGLRTAKEMLRKSVKRKEQDIDFEEKKMNLSLAQEEFDKENGYYGRVPSPEPRYVRHVPVEYPVPRPPEEYYGRRQVLYEPEYVPPPRERVRPYRELPSHRMPDYYNSKYEEEPQSSAKRPRSKREVIVQRVEERQGRGDEWSDPWMRSKSPGRRKESGRKRSYSSGSSYSSSSSSRSSSESSRSSYRSRSRSPQHRRASRSGRSRQISPSVIVSERKAANERAALMNPPAPKRRAPSPGMMRVSGAANPPAPSREDQFGRNRSKLAVAAALARVKGRRRSSRSSSGSSGSSSSDSDSSDSSSSTSRAGSSPPRRPPGMDISIAKAMDALKGGSAEKKQIKLNLKNPIGVRKPDMSDLARKPDPSANKKRPANSPPPGDPKSKKATSRREELLKQLKAVEDAIAKKRSKVN